MKYNKVKNKILIAITAATVFSSIALTAFADDISIYTGSKGGESESNVMFMLDVSGSMGWDDPTRISQVKSGLIDALNSLPDKIKVGLGIYNGVGASIIHPAEALGNISAGNVTAIINADNDDGYEDSSGTVTLSGDRLLFSGAKSTIIERSVNSYDDDAEQCADTGGRGRGRDTGYYYNNHSYLDLGIDKNCMNRIGTIFRNIDIPQGAKILNAHIEYTYAQRSRGKSADVEITIEDSANPFPYTSRRWGKVNSRRLYNAGNTEKIGKISWLPLMGGLSNDTVVTPDISPLVQAMVNSLDWRSGDRARTNALNVIVRTINKKRVGNVGFWTYDAQPTKAAKIVIEYSVDAAPIAPLAVTTDNVLADDSKLVGVKFSQLQVPSSVSLDEGYIEVTATDSVVNGGVINLSLISMNDSSDLLEEDNNISSRTVVREKSFTFNEWGVGDSYKLDVRDMLESYFGGPDWCSGGDLLFTLSSPTLGSIASSENSQYQSAKIVIDYSGANGDSCGFQSTFVTVDSPSGDGYVDASGNNFINQVYLLVGGNNKAALRFPNVNLDSDDEVVEAYIEFTGALDSGSNINFNVSADISNLNNPEPYSNNNGLSISDRTNLVGSIPTTMKPYLSGEKVRTENIATTINTLTGRADWLNGNALSLILSPTGGSSGYVFAYEYDVSVAPKLILVTKKRGELSGTTVRNSLITMIQNLDVAGGTPTLGSTIEAYQYFTGKDVISGKKRSDRRKLVSTPRSWTGGTLNTPSRCDPDSNYHSNSCANETISGSPVYTSPITDTICETNNIIMITDGYPSNQEGDYLADGTSVFAKTSEITGVPCSENWECIFGLTKHMAENDLMPNVDGIQNIYTNVIGFGDFGSKEDLEEYAENGLGAFYPVEDTSSLAIALEIIVDSILEIETTISTPGVSVNQNNKFQYLNELYYSVFKPSKLRTWKGNLKKYKIIADNTQGTSFKIIDGRGDDAIDPDSGFFREQSQSFWSSVEDGRDVNLGGASGELTNNRNLFTFTDPESTMINQSLSDKKFRLNKENNSLRKDDFKIEESWDNRDFNKFKDWISGVDVNDEDEDGSITDARKSYTDPLHAQPIVVNYSDTDSTVYVSTNDGTLHGVDAATGSELFGFVPKELLPNLYQVYKPRVGPHLYGLDSTWIAYRNDDDKSGVIGDDVNDFVRLYAGMRRGGSSYYSLDVTNIKASNLSTNIVPSINFIINADTAPEFANIGQTWSVPVLGKIKLNGMDKIVMVFGGGYDLSNDDPDLISTKDRLGSQLYMVDAITGELIWWASDTSSTAKTKIAGMSYSITSKPNIIDLDNDGYFDYIYVGDLGGQILKFRMNHNNTGSSNLATGKIFAKLGKSDVTTPSNTNNNRKIYEKISTVPVLDGYDKYMAIVIGTGHRASPIYNGTEDGLFVIKDIEILEDTMSEPTIDTGDLGDLTYTTEQDAVDEELDGKSGYVVWLKEGDENSGLFIGEKVIGEVVTFNNNILFTTYFPESEPKSCSPVAGVSRSYSINLSNANSGHSSDPEEEENDETPNQKRYVEQVLPGLAAGTKILYTDEGVVALTNTSTEGLGLATGLGLHKSSWYPKHEKDISQDETVVPPHLRTVE